ncbi:MAG: hypothetical protein KG003_14890 [Bacteroidetes bacterium]|nr:hypothetical protein [Bacteroidota bacterium]
MIFATVNIRKSYLAISYLFFPGTMAVGGFAFIIQQGVPIALPWHFWPAIIFCFAAFPVLGILLLIKRGLLENIHVAKRTARNRSYPLALAGAAIGKLYLHYGILTEHTVFLNMQLWALCINITLFLLWIINSAGLKISAHTSGTSGFLALCTAFLLQYPISWNWVYISVFICALVYIARFRLSAHSHKELIAGFCLGFIVTFAVFSL